MPLRENRTNYITSHETHETTCIPHRFLYSIFEQYYTNFKPLFLAKPTSFHHLFPFSFFLSTLRLFRMRCVIIQTKLISCIVGPAAQSERTGPLVR